MSKSSKIAILLCTYNGEEFLAEQLASYFSQTYDSWDLYVSDDGSVDRTRAILNEHFQGVTDHKLEMIDGPQQGFAANFLSLISRPDIDAEYFALSDQDDIWKTEKLERAIAQMSELPAGIPALYTSRVELIDERGDHLGYSPLYERPPSFANALIQNIAGGHAMIINREARDLLVKAGCADVPFHDWWVYQVVAGADGVVIYDPRPSVAYRQHLTNLVGLNTGWRARLSRLRNLIGGGYAAYHDRNNAALESLGSLISAENRDLLQRFQEARQQKFFARIKNMKTMDLYGQTPAKTASFWLMVLLGKV